MPIEERTQKRDADRREDTEKEITEQKTKGIKGPLRDPTSEGHNTL
jgi:hypothetical protein